MLLLDVEDLLGQPQMFLLHRRWEFCVALFSCLRQWLFDSAVLVECPEDLMTGLAIKRLKRDDVSCELA